MLRSADAERTKTKRYGHGENGGEANNYRNKERIEDMDEGNGALAGRGGGGTREDPRPHWPRKQGEDRGYKGKGKEGVGTQGGGFGS